MARKIFGTDGVRGLANQFPMDPETALGLGKAIAHIFKGRGGKHHRIVIGKDTRRSGYMLENALSSGICSMGGEAIFLGPIPTPGIAFITRAMRADAGVVISASHNPYYDNGLKFFDHQGYKLPDEIEAEMEALIRGDTLKRGPTHEQVGSAYRVDDAPGRYIEHLKSKFPQDRTLEGVKIAVDCANGAAYHIAPVVFEELGAEVVSIGVAPNGFNINERSGALDPSALQAKVLEVNADLGVALDGDADRLVLVDEKGQVVHGDALLALCARDLFERGKLAKNTVVATIMSNLGLEAALGPVGIKIIRVQVGDRYVIEAIRKDKFNFGGEQSGHLVFHDDATTGDGLLAALRVLAVQTQKQKTLSELSHGIHLFPQVLLNVRVQTKKDLDTLPSFKALQDKINKSLGKNGRLLVRYSGTEPLLRIMLEGEDLGTIQTYANDLKERVEKDLGKVR
jgi:phosphoglucosamine mutase